MVTERDAHGYIKMEENNVVNLVKPCVALFYKAGANIKDYIRKEKFRLSIKTGGSLKKLKEETR